MFCTLFFIFMTLGRESETSFIKVDTNEPRKSVERLVHGYINTINKMTMHFPNHEMQFQFEPIGPVLPTAPSPLPIRRTNSQMVKYPKKMRRSNNISTTDPTLIMSQVRQSKDSEKTPIYLEDLKKALDEFEKKLALNSNCNGIHNTPQSSTGQVHYSSQPTVKPHRNIQDILQLIGKGVTVDYNIPNPTDDSMDWLQIKIPNKI